MTHDQTEAMTLGDRVAVLRKGVIQQVDTPRNLYNDPANLFVAGFIGSPSMNLLPGTLNGTRLELPFGTIELPRPGPRGQQQRPPGDRRASAPSTSRTPARQRGGPREGRHLHQPHRGHRVDGQRAVRLPAVQRGRGDGRAKLDELAADLDLEQTSGENAQMVARFDAASRVAEGGEAEVWVDLRRIHLFDPDSGLTLNRHETSGRRGARRQRRRRRQQPASKDGGAAPSPSDPPTCRLAARTRLGCGPRSCGAGAQSGPPAGAAAR